MKCQICSNNLISSFRCRYCQNNYCSLTCLEIHCSEMHNNINNKNINNDINSYTQAKKNIESPFIVKGTLNTTILYDETYSLKNFLPVYEQVGKLKTIGSGSYGQVYLGLNQVDKKYYAIKHMEKKNIYQLLHSLAGIQKEIDIQSKIDHPNIVKLLYVKETEFSYDLIMEYAAGGNLFHYIRRNKGLNENKCFSLFIQVVNAVYFLHENDLIHRDIKPENILIFENDIVKLCDFGWCVKLEGQQRETFCGTTEYMSPELVKNQGYGKEIDVWSLGILLYEMIHGYSPFRPNKPHFNEKDVMINIINHNINFSKKVSDECKKLIYGLLDPNINKRYKVEDIYNSEFVKRYENIQAEGKTINNNEKSYINQNQINNIIYSPQFEMNNNINIHMSMDMKNYFYNIQIPETKKLYNDNIKARNQSFPKVNKGGVYPNYINSINNNGILLDSAFINNNYYINNNNNFENIMNNNNLDNINNTFGNNQNNNNNNLTLNKLNTNKTWNNFYPYDLEKNREKELIDLYSSQKNEQTPEDSKRDNINFINFNNNSFLNFRQSNNIFINKMNQINNNKQFLDNENISRIKNTSNTHYMQMSDISGIESQFNNLDMTNRIINDIIDNTNYTINNVPNTFTKNTINNYYYNSNDLSNNTLTNIYNNYNYYYYPYYPSLIKKTPINVDTSSINLDVNNTYMKNNIKNRNLNLSSVQISPIKIISEYKKTENNINSNYNRNDLKNNINSISKFNLNEQINNIHNRQEENEYNIYNINNDSSILIKSYNDSFKNKNHYLNKSDFFCINKNQRVADREKKKEKEPIDNMHKKKKKKSEEEKKIKEIDIINGNNNSNLRLIKKKEEKKLSVIQKYKKMSVMNSNKYKKENKNNTTNNTDSINISLYKNINFDQPNDIIPISNKSSSKIITQLIKSKSYSDKEKLNKNKNKYKKNNDNQNKYYSMNYKNDSSIKKNKELYNEKIMNYLYRKQDESSQLNTEGKNDNKKDNKIKKGISVNNSTEIKQKESNKLNIKLNNNNEHIKLNSMINEMISLEEILSKGKEKNPKDKNKNEQKKNFQNINSPNIKIKLEKNKTEANNSLKWIAQNQNSLINNKRNNKIGMKLGQNNQNRIYKSNGNKYLNANKTSDEKQNLVKKRFNLINKKKNNNIVLAKGVQNPLRLKSSISFNHLEEDKKIRNLNINKSKIVKNFKSKENNKYKFGRKQGIIPINKEEFHYRNNSYDYNNMNDEMNRTPKKKSIFNRVKPNKLIEAFRKELADNSKKENVIKLKKNLKV